MYGTMAAAFRNSLEVYEYLCRPLCEEENIRQGELDVLLFLANHPGMDTAVDIYKCGGIKQSMLSSHVEKLVNSGFLERCPIPGDRRKVRLECTEKAAPVIKKGQEIQKKLYKYIFDGISKEDIEAMKRVKTALEKNTLACKEKMLRGEFGE